ncbi:hypothetical protein [Marisediminicola antarctica]|uniref:hypothetical protein n=1 Tax=Marisediminicola antarctica TaxID=674079 RepID=UPI001F47619D|nr:hypothetical protein [Marisediminicola antarctica]
MTPPRAANRISRVIAEQHELPDASCGGVEAAQPDQCESGQRDDHHGAEDHRRPGEHDHRGGEGDRGEPHRPTDRAGLGLDEEGHNGDERDESELVPGAEQALDRAAVGEGSADAQEGERGVQNDARHDLEQKGRREDHPQHVAEGAHDLDQVTGQRDVGAEEGEGHLVRDGADGHPLVVAPEHGQRAPADEDEERDGEQPVPLQFMALHRDRRGRENDECAEDAEEAGPSDGAAQREGEECHADRAQRQRPRETGGGERRECGVCGAS